jgi:HlyD family secretion protein
MTEHAIPFPTPAVAATPASPASGAAMDRVVPASRRAFWLRAALVAAAACGVVAALAWAMPRGLPVRRADLTIAPVAAGTFDDELVVRAAVVPAHSVLLDATDGGRVDAVMVADGAIVHAGDLLYRLSNPQREQEVLARSADVAQQLSNLSIQRAALAAARAAQRRDLASLAFEQERADAEAGRTRRLAADGFLSPAALEDADRRSALQRRLVQQAREDGNAEMRTREQSLRELERAVAGLDEGLRLVRDAAAGLAARAPGDGRLAGFALQVGASVHPGDHLGRVDEGGGFKLSASVDEFYRDRLRVGQRAVLDAASGNGPQVALRLARIDPQISNGHVGVELEFAGAVPRALQAGQGIDVHLVLGDARRALLLSDGAFYADSGGAWVYVLDAQGDTARRRAVHLGRRAAGRIEVVDGLQAGDRVIVSGVRRFGDAARLRLVD